MDVVVNAIKDEAPAESRLLDSQGTYYQNTLLCLGYSLTKLPLADLLRHYHQLEGQWLIASPIHWEATHNDAMIVAIGESLELTDQESRMWFTEVKQFLQADGFTPVYHDAHTWLFNIDNKPSITSKTLPAIMHQSLMPILDSMDSTLFWQRLITEMQMYLSPHQLNAKRETKLAINGLWFWGEGRLEVNSTRPMATDDDVLLSLSDSTSMPICPLTAATTFEKDHLLIIKNPEQIDSCKLEEKIRKKKVHWYWNNLAYSTSANHWWSRLWR